MLHHLGIFTPPELLEKTIAFYLAALAPLGYTKLVEYGGGVVVGLGDGSRPADFWISSIALKQNHDPSAQVGYSHFAFEAKTRSQVDEFHTKGLEAGGKDNGAPGLRPQYRPNYYAAFLIDPAGNGTEVLAETES